MNPLATTIVIPVKNGGTRLKECLEAAKAQKTSFPFKVLCIDSGSTDDSLDVIKDAGADFYCIKPEDFGHGKTRNLGVTLSQTPFVAMLTQDSVPASESWLQELIEPFRWDESVAGVFGPHLPHPGCREIEARMLERHFAGFGSRNTTFRIGERPRTWNEYAQAKDYFVFFSDNNAALRKSVWERIPYPDVEFMEDQLWAAAILEAGYSKVWAPRAAVRHSHNYDIVTTLRRSFDEARFRREYQDPNHSWTLPKWLDHARQAVRRDLARSSARNVRRWAVDAPSIVLRNHADALGRYLGDKSPFLPQSVINAISQHVSLKGSVDDRSVPKLKDEVKRYLQNTFATKGTIDGTAALTHQVVHFARAANLAEALLGWRRQLRQGPATGEWWNGRIYQSMTEKAAPLLKDRTAIQHQELVLNWIIPPFGKGGGGHQTIFRTIHLLEKRGVLNRVYVLEGDLAMPYPTAQLRALVHDWFAPIEGPVEPLRAAMLPADFAIATHWSTVYPMRALGNSVAQAYFIQDFEPSFYPAGAEAAFATQTYRMGLYGITAGRWLAQLMRDRFGMAAESFELAVDHEVYWKEPATRAGRSIFAYMRPQTARRGFELVALALREVKRHRPDVEIHTAGADLPASMLPFPFTCHGVLTPEALRHQYSNATVGVCLSLTNYSLVPQEMAACGCPVVDVDGENTVNSYPKGAVALAPPTVEGLAAQILRLLDDNVERRRQIQKGFDYAQGLSWEVSADQVLNALLKWSESTAQVGAKRSNLRRKSR